MAKYSKGAQEKVHTEMHEMKEGKLNSGSGAKVTNPKQAIAIGLSEARKEGKKAPEALSKGTSEKKSAPTKNSTATKKSATKKSASAKDAPKKTASKKSSTKK